MLNSQEIFDPIMLGIPVNELPVVVDIVPYDLESINSYNPGNTDMDRIYVNDNEGTMTFKIVYKNIIDGEGQLNSELQLSEQPITLTGFKKAHHTQWKKGVHVEKQNVDGELADAIEVNLKEYFASVQVSQWDRKLPPSQTITKIVKDRIQELGSSELNVPPGTPNYIANEKEGWVSTLVHVNGWNELVTYKHSADDNVKGIMEGSIFVRSTVKPVAIKITGFKPVDLQSVEQTRSNLVYVATGLGGLILVLVIALVVFKKKF